MAARRLGWIALTVFIVSIASLVFAQSQGTHSVNPDGSFSYRIPIEVPPGIRGVQPNLALVYNSNAGNGMLGMGWSLEGLPVITRMNYGNGVNFNAADTFDGPNGRLMPVAGQTYRGEYDAWTKYERTGGSSAGCPLDEPQCTWLVTDRNGNKAYFGYTADSKILGTGYTKPLFWALNRFEDFAGNAFTVTYAPAGGYPYPDRIDYAGHEIRFEYIARPGNSKEIHYNQTAEVRFDSVLDRIVVDWGTAHAVTYQVNYDQGDLVRETPGGTIMLARIASVVQTAADGESRTHSFAWQERPTDSQTFSGYGDYELGLTVTDYFGDGRGSYWSHGIHNHYVTRFNRTSAGSQMYTVNSDIGGGWWRFADIYGDGRPVLISKYNTPHLNLIRRFNQDNSFQGFPNYPTGQIAFARNTETTIGFASIYGNGKQQRYSYGYNTTPGACYSGDGYDYCDPPTYSNYTLQIFDYNQTSATTARQTFAMVLPEGNWGFFDLFGTGKAVLWWNSPGSRVHHAREITPSGLGQSWSWTSQAIPGTANAYGNGLWRFGDIFGDGRQVFFSPDGGGKFYATIFHKNGGVKNFAWTNGHGLGNRGWLLADAFGDGRMVYYTMNQSDGAHHITRFNADQTLNNLNISGHTVCTDGWLAADATGEGRDGFWSRCGGSHKVSMLKTWFANGIAQVTTPDGGLISVAYTPNRQVDGAIQPQKTTCGDDASTGGQNTTVGIGYGAPCGQSNRSGRQVVTQLTLDGGNPASAPASFSYQYSNGRLTTGTNHAQVDLGYQTVTIVHDQTGAKTETVYNQTVPYNGSEARVRRSIKVNGADVVVQEETTTYASRSASAPYRVVPATKQTALYEVSGGVNAPVSTVSQVFGFDDHDNLQFHSRCLGTQCYDEAQYAAACPTAQCEVTLRAFTADPAFWRLSRLDSERTTDGVNNLSYKVFSYHPNDDANLGRRGQLSQVQQQYCPDENACTGTGGLLSVASNLLYDAVGNPTVLTDARGNSMSFIWDPARPMLKTGESRMVGSQTLQHLYQYDGFGRMTQWTDFNGKLWNTEFDGLGRKTMDLAPLRTGQPNPGTTSYAYENAGQPTSQNLAVTRYDGVTYTQERTYVDGFGFQYRVERPGDGQTSVQDWERSYSNDGTMVITEFRPGYGAANHLAFTQSVFDGLGRKIRQIGPGALDVTITYGGCTPYTGLHSVQTAATDTGSSITQTTCEYFDGWGQLVSKIDPLGNETEYTYNAARRLTAVYPPDGQAVTLTYDSWGRKTSLTDPALGAPGAVGIHQFGYDEAGNTTLQVDNAGTQTLLTYDALNRVTSKTLKDLNNNTLGVPVLYTYDDPAVLNGMGRLTKVVDGSGMTEFKYDETGNVNERAVTINGISGVWVESRLHDLRNRLKTLTLPDNRAIQYTYLPNGMVSEVSIEGKILARYSNYTADNRVQTKTTNPGYSEASFTNYTYNPQTGRLASTLINGTDGGNGSISLQQLSYAFDAFGNPTQLTDGLAGGVETQSFTFDALNRLVSANAPNAYGSKTNTFSPGGNLTQMYSSARAFEYDTSKTKLMVSYDDIESPLPDELSADYDAAGNMIRKTDNALTWEYTYDAENRLVSAQKTTALDPFWIEFVYNYNGDRVKKIVHFQSFQGQGTNTTYYIGRNFVLRQNSSELTHRRTVHISVPGIDRVASITEIYDAAVADLGQARYFAYAGMFDPTTPGGLAKRAAYTALGWLSKPNIERHLLLGLVGLAGGFLLLTGLTVLAARRGSSRLLAIPAELRLAALGLVVVLLFTACGDGGGRNSNRGAQGGSVSQVIPPKYNPLYDLPYYGDLTQLQGQYPDDGMQPGTWFYHSNHLGSTTLVTDALGALAARLRYLPYGELDASNTTLPVPVAYTYTGQEYDSEIGLLNYRARMYDPGIGRFLTPDSIVDGGGSDGQGFNRYAYARNNPVTYSDPSGHSAWKEFSGGAPFSSDPRITLRPGKHPGDGKSSKKGNCFIFCGGTLGEIWNAYLDVNLGLIRVFSPELADDADPRNWDRNGQHNAVLVMTVIIIWLCYGVCLAFMGAAGPTYGVYATAGFFYGYSNAKIDGGSDADAIRMGAINAATFAGFAWLKQQILYAYQMNVTFGTGAFYQIGGAMDFFFSMTPGFLGLPSFDLASRHYFPDSYLPDNIDRIDDREHPDSVVKKRKSGCFKDSSCYRLPTPNLGF